MLALALLEGVRVAPRPRETLGATRAAVRVCRVLEALRVASELRFAFEVARCGASRVRRLRRHICDCERTDEASTIATAGTRLIEVCSALSAVVELCGKKKLDACCFYCNVYGDVVLLSLARSSFLHDLTTIRTARRESRSLIVATRLHHDGTDGESAIATADKIHKKTPLVFEFLVKTNMYI